MRRAFVETLTRLASADDRIVLLTGDLGFMALEPFAEAHPSRFLNMGVAEQNMVGVATGLAESGFLPFVYSIAPFAVLRPYEFIRNGPVLHQLPVRIVGVGGGFEYGAGGPTHHALEDVAVTRAHPGLTVIAPADHEQTREAILQTYDSAGPIYYRLGKDDKTVVAGLRGRFSRDEIQMIDHGSDVLILAIGAVAAECPQAVDELRRHSVAAGFGVVASINPPPVASLVDAIRRYPVVVTVEAHFVNGGLGSLVAEIVAEHSLACKLVRCGVRTLAVAGTGSQRHLHMVHGLNSSALADAVLTSVRTSSAAK